MAERAGQDRARGLVTRRAWEMVGWVWRNPARLGLSGALLALVAFALPWYTTLQGAVYDGFSLIFSNTIPYAYPTSVPDCCNGPYCTGVRSGFSAPSSALLAAVVIAGLASAALAWRPLGRWQAWALTLATLTAGWAGLLAAYMWLRAAFASPFYTSFLAVRPAGCEIGSYGLAFYALPVALVVIVVAGFWGALTQEAALPLQTGSVAALGLLAFVAPWGVSPTPGVALIISSMRCNPAALQRTGGDLTPCLFWRIVQPFGTVSSGSILAYSVAFAVQALALAIVLALAILVARRGRDGGWPALRTISALVGAGGALSMFLAEGPLFFLDAMLGLALLALAFVLLAVFGLRSGVEARPPRAASAVSG